MKRPKEVEKVVNLYHPVPTALIQGGLEEWAWGQVPGLISGSFSNSEIKDPHDPWDLEKKSRRPAGRSQ